MDWKVLPQFREYVIRTLNPPSDKRADFWPITEEFSSKENPIKEWELIYKDQAGNVKVIQIDVNVNYEKQLISVFLLSMEGEFKVADDLYIMRTQKSKWGGIYTSDKISFKKVPHVVTNDEM